MRVLHTADWHVGRSIRGRSRAAEHRQVLSEIAEIAGGEEADLVLVAGDLFDTAAPTPEAEEIVWAGLLDLADTGADVVLVSGNHDNPRRLEAVRPLLDRTRHVHAGALLRRPEQGGVLNLELRTGETARVALFPFLSQRRIVRADALMHGEAGDHGLLYAERCAALVRSLCGTFSEDTVNLLVGHLMVIGALAGGGERVAHTIGDYCVPASIFDHPALHYVALGHVHRMQELAGPCPVWYAGSPLQLDFGESGEGGQVLLVEARPGVPAEVRRIPVRSGRRLVTLRGNLASLETRIGESGDDYLRIVVEEAARPGLGDEIRELFPNAVDVRIAERDAPDAPSFDTLESLRRKPREIFEEFLEERGVAAETLLALFDDLLEEVYEAEAP